VISSSATYSHVRFFEQEQHLQAVKFVVQNVETKAFRMWRDSTNFVRAD
jgi:hypothetical protein